MEEKKRFTLQDWFEFKKGRRPVPAEKVHNVAVPNIKDARAYADEPDNGFIGDMLESIKQEGDDFLINKPDGIREYPVLAVSGGSANGAFGAGLLNGWTKHGSRPKFKVVTGISTGSLIAPAAFLGEEYDAAMKKFFTTSSTKDILKQRGPVRGFFAGSFTTNRPLARIIKENYDKKLISDVAREHKKGRRLYIGTTNLDTQRMVLWNMGKIALAGDDAAIKLFQNVILASTSIPVLFPPVFFDVEVDGEMFEEMHVDGSAVAQAFFLYGVLSGFREAAMKEGTFNDKAKKTSRISRIKDVIAGVDRSKEDTVSKVKVRLYVIRNGYLQPKWNPTKVNVPSIAGRSVETMINAQAMGDVVRLYAVAKDRGHDFNLAHIPVEFDLHAKEMFDPEDMTRLFDMAYEKASGGYPWSKAPYAMAKLGNK
ncbi:patatin-like phospholipase family protein [Candidatus Omnitrophota bacterium]